jgi:hypothetical protein
MKPFLWWGLTRRRSSSRPADESDSLVAVVQYPVPSFCIPLVTVVLLHPWSRGRTAWQNRWLRKKQCWQRLEYFIGQTPV